MKDNDNSNSNDCNNIFVNNLNNNNKPFQYKHNEKNIHKDGIELNTSDALPVTLEDGYLPYKKK